MRNILLFVISLIFYWYGQGNFVLPLLCSIIFNYTVGLLIERINSKKFLRKTIFFLGVAGNVVLLYIFKYLNFSIESINKLWGTSIHTLDLILPIGLSFFTFKSISYLADIYMGKCKVEKKLFDMGYTYDNGMVSKWMSEDKRDLPKNLTDNDGIPVFLLMKQAISTGWDCPRAKILVKLREGMSENFQIQTIGRIRRMPEAKHYEDDLLDFCYVYTFDEKFKAGMLQEEDRAYITRRLFLKDKCKTFQLEKEVQNLQYEV